MEIHDELAAQIQNSTEAVEYIDGVSSIAEEDDEKSTLTSIQEEREFDMEGEEKNPDDEEEEVQIDTFRVIGIRRSPGECLVSDWLFFTNRFVKLRIDPISCYPLCLRRQTLQSSFDLRQSRF